jgi:hypothetical protein
LRKIGTEVILFLLASVDLHKYVCGLRGYAVMHSMFCRCLQCWRYCSANKAVGDCPCCPGLCSGGFLAAVSRHRCGIVGFFRIGGFSSNVGWLPRRTSMTPDCSYKTASLQSPNVSISTALFRPNVGLRIVGRGPAWYRVGRQAPVIAVDLHGHASSIDTIFQARDIPLLVG